MITFIPKDDEGNGRAGIRAGANALLVMLAVPVYLWSKRAVILATVRGILRRNNASS
jgi:hypothetical protein